MDYTKKLIEHGVVQADPLPDIEFLKDYYQNKYFQIKDVNSKTYDTTYTKNELEHKKLESRLQLSAISENTNFIDCVELLEIGFGEGFFLEEAHKLGWVVSGADFSQFGVAKWHPHLLPFCEFGDTFDYVRRLIENKKKFHVCALRNVLEHVIDPAQLISQIKKILTPDGVLLISIPNDYSDLQKKAIELSHIDQDFWFSPPEHLYYFNTDNISAFLTTHQMKVVDVFTSFPVDFFLFHPGSNYIKDKNNGKAAHYARVDIDLMMAKKGLSNLLNMYRATAKCGVGRDLTVLAVINDKMEVE